MSVDVSSSRAYERCRELLPEHYAHLSKENIYYFVGNQYQQLYVHQRTDPDRGYWSHIYGEPARDAHYITLNLAAFHDEELLDATILHSLAQVDDDVKLTTFNRYKELFLHDLSDKYKDIQERRVDLNLISTVGATPMFNYANGMKENHFIRYGMPASELMTYYEQAKEESHARLLSLTSHN